MLSSFRPEDVTLLLKDITGLITPLDTEERERRIQSGVHYSEMLPVEYEPTEEYMRAYNQALSSYSAITAIAVAKTAEKIWKAYGSSVVLVSLARAGTPIGILLKRYLDGRHSCSISHYSVSIIRDKGIDRNAIGYILKNHPPQSICFVDGWTGKGAIQKQLDSAMEEFPYVNSKLAVLSDPAYVAGICGTHDDFLIASSCLNATVSGLISRTFFRPDIIGNHDYHGVAFYNNLREKDCTYQFIDSIVNCFPDSITISDEKTDEAMTGAGLREAIEIQHRFGIESINFVKPSIGEATRVLLRRMPWKILVRSLDDNAHLGHLYQLAKEKHVEVLEYPLRHYRACGLIRTVSDT